MRKIPMKNYLIMLFITVITIFLCIYLFNFYNNKKNYENSRNARMGFLKEIHSTDFENYITENSESIIYVSNSDDTNMESFETELKKKIKKLEYDNDMVYLNSKDIKDNFTKILNKYLSNSLKTKPLENIPNILIIKNSNIEKYYFVKTDTTVNDAIKFIHYGYED